MKSFLRKTYKKTVVGNWLRNLVSKLKGLVPDKIYVSQKYRFQMKRPLELNPPKTLNEKINWLKLYERNSLLTQCADKYAVREFVSKIIGKEYLVPLYFVTNKPKDIVPEVFSKVPCIIKTNHDSGGGIFIYQKSGVDWGSIQKKLNRRLKRNYYKESREWQYKNIKPCIIVEKLLQDGSGKIPNDYKLHCFNGKVRMISVDIDRGTDNHNRNWFNVKWQREPYRWSSRKSNGKMTDPSDEPIERPSTLDKMIELSEKLAGSFDYVRVDWYDVEDRLYFGELTFHHDGGYRPILPKEWDLKLGNELRISNFDIVNTPVDRDAIA